jgi:hypothetical protein
MKKLICTFFVFSIALLGFAELRKPCRTFEIGVDADAAASNDYFDLRDIMVQDIVFDLQKIASEMPSQGLDVNALVDAKVFMNVNTKNSLRIGFFTEIDAYGNANIPQALFKKIAEGNALDEAESYKLAVNAEVFYNMGFTYHNMLETKFGKIGLSITPSYYLPIAYVPDANATVSYSTSSDGTITANATAPLDVYTAIDMKQFLDSNSQSKDIASQLGDVLKNGGFDIAFEVERNIFKSLDVGLFARVPVLPGHLTYKTTVNVTASAQIDNIIGALSGNDTTTTNYDVGNYEYSSVNKKLYRPLRIGFEGAWRPFGSWSTFRPMFAVVVREPYSNNAVCFPEYALNADFTLFNIVGCTFGTAYQDQIFIQRVGFMLNTHVIQFNVQASLEGSDFVNSFNWGGAGVYAGVRIGF